MSERILVVAPHPDDETLGAGGFLFRKKSEEAQIHWLLVTEMSENAGFSVAQIAERAKEIKQVEKLYGFTSVHSLGFAPAALDRVAKSEVTQKISQVFKTVAPTTLLVPWQGDVHSDHGIVYEASISAAKWFRNPSIEKILAYETLSETDQAVGNSQFQPNVFVDITKTLDSKIAAMKIYHSECGEHPFPRSERTLRSLAEVRGAASGFQFAESFVLLKERF